MISDDIIKPPPSDHQPSGAPIRRSTVNVPCLTHRGCLYHGQDRPCRVIRGRIKGALGTGEGGLMIVPGALKPLPHRRLIFDRSGPILHNESIQLQWGHKAWILTWPRGFVRVCHRAHSARIEGRHGVPSARDLNGRAQEPSHSRWGTPPPQPGGGGVINCGGL